MEVRHTARGEPTRSSPVSPAYPAKMPPGIGLWRWSARIRPERGPSDTGCSSIDADADVEGAGGTTKSGGVAGSDDTVVLALGAVFTNHGTRTTGR